MALRTYPGRLLFASAGASLFVLAASGFVAGYLYLEQSRTADALSEDIGSRGAAVNMEATLNSLIVLHNRSFGSVEPLHEQVLLDLEEIDRFADKAKERELVQVIRAGFKDYLKQWRQGIPGRELAEYLRTNPLAAVQALRQYNGGELTASEETHRRSVRRMMWGLVAVGGLGSVAGLLLGYGLARSLRRAVQQFLIRVQGATELLGQQAPAVQLEGIGEPLWDGADDLVRRVEQAVRRLNEQEREVRRTERLAAVGQLAAGVAHEIRNPLTSAILLLETGRKDPSAGLTEEDLDLIEQELNRIEGTLQTFLSFARPPKPERTDCDLADVITETVAVARGRIGLGRIEATVCGADRPYRLVADRGQIGQVVLNLILNAVEAMPNGGRLKVELHANPAEGTVGFSVSDTGSGIAAEILPRLFEPFATGKETGTGLGLVVSKRLIDEHGGTIQGFNPPGGGARFVVHLPVKPPSGIPASAVG